MKIQKTTVAFTLPIIAIAIVFSSYIVKAKSDPHQNRVVIPFDGENQSFQVTSESGIGHIKKNDLELLTVSAQLMGKTIGYECNVEKVSFSNQSNVSSDINRHWLLPHTKTSPSIKVERKDNNEVTFTLKNATEDTFVALAPKNSNDEYLLKDEAWILWEKQVSSTPNETIYRYGLKLTNNRSYCAEGRPMIQAEFYDSIDDQGQKIDIEKSTAILFNAQTGVLTRQKYPSNVTQLDFSQYEEQTMLNDAVAKKAVKYDLATDKISILSEGVGVINQLDPRGEVVKKLYHSDNGRYVHQQISTFNEQNFAGLRVNAGDSVVTQKISDSSRWKIYTEEQSYANQAFENKLYQYITDPAIEFGSWQFTRSDKAGVYHFQTVLPQSLQNTDIQLLSLGRITGIKGGRIQSEQNICENGLTCYRYIIFVQDKQLDVQVQSTKNSKIQSSALRVQGDKMIIKPPKQFTSQYMGKASELTISDKTGQLLFANQEPTDLAWELNLSGLIGLNRTDGLRYAFNLAAPEGTVHQNARLTIDPSLQNMAVKVLNCIGQSDGEWHVPTQQCVNTKAVPEKRESAMLIMDAVTGEILTATNGTIVPKTGAYKELSGYSNYHPSHSVLVQKSWIHDGGLTNMPGSSFKLVTSMALEQQAPKNPTLAQDLTGRSIEQINALGQSQNFTMNSLCFPMDCTKKVKLSNLNYGENQPNAQGNYGIVEALLHSSNTWFGYMTERYLAKSFDHRVRSMAFDGMDDSFPLHRMAHQLGFEQTLTLDGGLMADTLPENTILEATPSVFDPMMDVHSLRQMAIGLRMQVTPLQMARVAGAIATGQLSTPYLIAELNGKNPQLQNTTIENIPFEQIRAGMNAVITGGTAQTAFSDPAFDKIRDKIYAKTGTAEIEGKTNNVAWLVGYLDVGTLVGQKHPLAFAVKISDTAQMGGASAAKVMAKWLQAVNQAK